jgi:osmoprotectant transport system substrate-binding protein
VGGALLAALVLLASGAQAADRIRVGSKIDTEGALLGNLIVLQLEKAGLAVENRIQLGPTRIVRTALLAGEIDIYPEYTGNAGFFFHRENDPALKDAAAAWELAKKLDAEQNKLVWLKPAPADNSWAIAVRGDVAKTQKLATLEDFAGWANKGGAVKLAGSAEFVESAAGLPSFQTAYGFKLDKDRLLVLSGGDTAATMKAAAQGTSGVNAAMVYGTDGAIPSLGLVVMRDTKGIQPVYQPAPVVRAAVLQAHPQIATALEPVFARLTLETLQTLNGKIAVDGLDAKQVAADWLATAVK